MGVREQDNRRKTLFGQDNNSLFNLIAINIIAFVLLYFVLIIYYLSGSSRSDFFANVFSWVSMPASLNELLYKPWTIITHMIAHISIWQLIGNMLWLWAFGFILQDLTGNSKLIPIYIYGALAGALFYLLSFNLIPRLQPLITTDTYFGAGAGVTAIVVATTLLAPGYRIFQMLNGGIPLWVITIIYVLIDFAGLSSNAFPHHVAHLAGAGMGAFFINRLHKGQDWSEWMNNAWESFINLFNPDKPAKKQKPVKQQLFYNNKGRNPFKKTTNITEQKINEILDKISQKGYDSLSKEEKEILRRAGEENNIE
ncbi:MAG TPA: rhomboid family intramembrane serine protease [Chitinophagaceae bacterium]|nr:rhomboid family intramembrane serine protease [Chitinophagaceae bacterium]